MATRDNGGHEGVRNARNARDARNAGRKTTNRVRITPVCTGAIKDVVGLAVGQAEDLTYLYDVVALTANDMCDRRVVVNRERVARKPPVHFQFLDGVIVVVTVGSGPCEFGNEAAGAALLEGGRARSQEEFVGSRGAHDRHDVGVGDRPGVVYRYLPVSRSGLERDRVGAAFAIEAETGGLEILEPERIVTRTGDHLVDIAGAVRNG